MQSGRPQPRAPGSFSPLPGSHAASSISSSAAAAAASAAPSSASLSGVTTRPQIRHIDTSSSEDTTSSIYVNKTRSPQTPTGIPTSPFAKIGALPNSSTQSLQSSPQNFSRPNRSNADAPNARNASPLTLAPHRAGHARKHSQTQGLFEATLPSTSTSNLSSVGMSSQPSPALSASQIAAQAAMQHQQHSRQRSQTVPAPGADSSGPGSASGFDSPGSKGSSRQGLASPPMLSLTEASAPRDSGFGNQSYHNGLLGSHTAAATTAANVVFPRTSPASSPGLPSEPLAPPPAPPMPEKMLRMEKPSSKVKLFSRPKKIETKGETKERPLPSPGKIGSALAGALQRGNYSATSLTLGDGSAPSLYSLGNSSSATIRAVESSADGPTKEKEKKHHFLSRQKHKLSSKDDYHLPLSSASSNSRPVDPSAPSSLYSFHLPPSPGPNSTSFNVAKSVSGLDLRHGGRGLRDRKKETGGIYGHENESTFTLASVGGSDWPGPSSFGNSVTTPLIESLDSGKYGLNNMTVDDAWPFLKAKLLVIFEGEDLRLPVEDFNRVVTIHIQYCMARRSAYIIIEDLRDLLSTGFASLDQTLRMTPEDRLIPALVELWVFTFTSILPYMQAIFLPLDLELAGNGPLMTADQARDFWGGVMATSPAPSSFREGGSGNAFDEKLAPASDILDVRRLVLLAYRDALILPRYEKLKTIFSRLSLEHLPYSLASLALASPPPMPAADSLTSLSSSPSEVSTISARPGTAMSVDPSVASYNSSSTTLLGEGSLPSRSRAISNVSYGSGASDPMSAGGMLRPFTPGRERGDSTGLASVREQNVEDSKQVTEMVGRMLQCMSVLASVGPASRGNGSLSEGAGTADDRDKMVAELGRLLKLNWLGRGRTGRNRRGIVGGRVKREETSSSGLASLREGVSAAG